MPTPAATAIAPTLAFNPVAIFAVLIGFTLVLLLIGGAVWYFMSIYRFRNREERSLSSVLLLVTVSRNNEIKIDAMEQMFASLYSIKKGGWAQRFDTQPIISFEIVAKQEEIKFYVWTLNHFRI
jgi:hypothetical protein